MQLASGSAFYLSTQGFAGLRCRRLAEWHRERTGCCGSEASVVAEGSFLGCVRRRRWTYSYREIDEQAAVVGSRAAALNLRCVPKLGGKLS